MDLFWHLSEYLSFKRFLCLTFLVACRIMFSRTFELQFEAIKSAARVCIVLCEFSDAIYFEKCCQFNEALARGGRCRRIRSTVHLRSHACARALREHMTCMFLIRGCSPIGMLHSMCCERSIPFGKHCAKCAGICQQTVRSIYMSWHWICIRYPQDATVVSGSAIVNYEYGTLRNESMNHHLGSAIGAL